MNKKTKYLSVGIIFFFCFLVIFGIYPQAATKGYKLTYKNKKVAIDKEFRIRYKAPKSKVVWTVGNENVVRLRKNSGSKKQNAVIQAVGTGTTYVAAHVIGKSKIYTCKVTVYDPIRISGTSSITNGSSKYLKISGNNKYPRWSTSDSSIITVKRTSKHKVKITANATGTAYITAIVSGRVYSHKVVVHPRTGKAVIAVAKCNTGEDGLAAAKVRECGATVKIVKNISNIDAYDGLILPGGGDINPSRYHEKNVASKNINDKLDKQQLKLLEQFVRAGKPVLGICRGEQLINVYFGGSLKQHINGHKKLYHNTSISTGSVMERLYGDSIKVYSSHHQAVKTLGAGLIATQWASDGNIEAIEHETLPVIAVQWHPELMGDMGKTVITYFVNLCEEHR